MSEFLKRIFTRKLRVGDPLEWKGEPDYKLQERPVLPHVSTIVRIIKADGADIKGIISSLTENQTLLSGENLLDDPSREGKIDPRKLYVLEE